MSTAAKETPTLLAQELFPGHVIAGKYVIDRVLGRGGVGVVVSATHLALEQKVAIKFLRSDVALSEDTTQRFLQEARAAAMLRSEHVARVHDFGMSEQGHAYIVMEHLEGMDLGNVLDTGPLPIEAAVEYVLQTCLALAEAHRAGIVHRDLKPANLFLTRRPDGQPVIKILDFGISKIVPKTPRGSNAALVTTNANMGSPEYMSPEQMRSAKSVDHRVDIWALGIVLYELITGLPAFTADTIQQLFHLIDASEPTPVESLRPDVPDAVKDVIARCLQKNRMDRFADVAELAVALRPAAKGRAAALVDAVVATLDGPASVGSSPGTLAPETSTVRSNAHVISPLPTADSRAWKGPVAWLGTRSIAMLLALVVGAGVVATLLLGRIRAPSSTVSHAPVPSTTVPVAKAAIPPQDPAPTTPSSAAPPTVPMDSLPSAKPAPVKANAAHPGSPNVSVAPQPPLPSPTASPAPVVTAFRPVSPPSPKPLEGTAAYGDRK
jgi:serine/threonine protein kinase